LAVQIACAARAHAWWRRWTALHYASQNGHTATTKALIAAGARVESAQLDDFTAAQLKGLCGACGLTKAGRKPDLLARLRRRPDLFLRLRKMRKKLLRSEEPPHKKQKTEAKTKVRPCSPRRSGAHAPTGCLFVCLGRQARRHCKRRQSRRRRLRSTRRQYRSRSRSLCTSGPPTTCARSSPRRSLASTSRPLRRTGSTGACCSSSLRRRGCQGEPRHQVQVACDQDRGCAMEGRSSRTRHPALPKGRCVLFERATAAPGHGSESLLLHLHPDWAHSCHKLGRYRAPLRHICSSPLHCPPVQGKMISPI
jgi:hypothetical protein